jgi:PLP dependent protein
MGVDYQARVHERLPAIRESIAQAAGRAGRDPDDVRIVAVTKGHSLEAVRAATAAGLVDLGENRVEELEEKVQVFGREGVRWHMVGHLQRRKVPRVLATCDLLHSVGTVALARRVSDRWLDAARGAPVAAGARRTAHPGLPPGADAVSEPGGGGHGTPDPLGTPEGEPGRDPGFPVLLQVNTSGEGAKGGFRFEGAEDELAEVLELPGLQVRGLMTMAPFTEQEAVLRRTFRRLRELQEALVPHPRYRGRELSMGMTNDYTIAVEEGSTMVRLGTALFGERPA